MTLLVTINNKQQTLPYLDTKTLPKELSTAHKVWKSEHFHQQRRYLGATVFTNDVNPTNEPGHVEHLRQLFPHPSADHDSPL